MIMKTKGTSLIGSPQNTKEGAFLLPLLYSKSDNSFTNLPPSTLLRYAVYALLFVSLDLPMDACVH